MYKYSFIILLGYSVTTFGQEVAIADNTLIAPAPSSEKVETVIDIANNFDVWIAEFEKFALTQSIKPKTLKSAKKDFIFDPKVIALDRKQPESMLDFDTYYEARVPLLIDKAKKNYTIYKNLLEKTSKKYQVPASVIVALWGMETNFGKLKGKHSVLGSLATLAYEGRRADYFKQELINALKIMQDYNINHKELKGSWAGAMGHCQFMPTTFLLHAVDEDQDTKPDIWHSIIDVFASMANYLHNMGWNSQEPILIAIELSDDFDVKLISPDMKKTWKEWQNLGVQNLGEQKVEETLIGYLQKAPLTDKVYLVFNNYELLLKWNKSNNFAISVGLFAGQLEGL